jgi:hypothetical protein
VWGASFDKKEFKRNVVGSGAYAPSSTVGYYLGGQTKQPKSQ